MKRLLLDTCAVIDLLVASGDLSSDTRFWYYRDQGLELIEY